MTADGHACVCARTTHRPKILIFVTACGNRVSGEAAFANCSLGTTVEHRLLACAPSGHAVRSFPPAGSKPAGHTDWKSMYGRGLTANEKVRDPESIRGHQVAAATAPQKESRLQRWRLPGVPRKSTIRIVEQAFLPAWFRNIRQAGTLALQSLQSSAACRDFLETRL